MLPTDGYKVTVPLDGRFDVAESKPASAAYRVVESGEIREICDFTEEYESNHRRRMIVTWGSQIAVTLIVIFYIFRKKR